MKYRRKETSKAEWKRMAKKLFKRNLELVRASSAWRELVSAVADELERRKEAKS